VRVLLLSDIHANLEALEACLEAAPSHDLAVNLGDVVGYGASPNEVVERVRHTCGLHVRGNHDKACCGTDDIAGFNPIATIAAVWTRQQLTPASLQWLCAMGVGPLTAEGVADTEFVHGSPLGEDEYLVSVTDALIPLMTRSVGVTFFGHTHLQGGFSLYNEGGSEITPHIDYGDDLDFSELPLHPQARYLLNPGSVGQPRDGDWRAAFALFDSSARVIRFYRVPYDVDGARRRILQAGLPERLASRLVLGR
jgi:diadenosine tetraphosphatase ApaH/serine/threonine PP2A family protein phosphatase